MFGRKRLYTRINNTLISHYNLLFFFFQAEDGIRDLTVTGVQTCALPISRFAVRRTLPSRTAPTPSSCASARSLPPERSRYDATEPRLTTLRSLIRARLVKIGRASCRERV